MSNISRSPFRNTFQKEAYIKRAEETGEELNAAYIEMWETESERTAKREADPEWQKDNLEWDLRTTDWILEKARASDTYAQNLYAAMCNREFMKHDVIPILKKQTWGCSWRHAGGIIADMQQKGDYIDWYCSGIRDGGYQDDLDTNKPTQFVSESCVTDEIRADLMRLGWIVLDDDDN